MPLFCGIPVHFSADSLMASDHRLVRPRQRPARWTIRRHDSPVGAAYDPAVGWRRRKDRVLAEFGA
jgi:hypothetical protein